MPKSPYNPFLNRELSWLDFNLRVLNEARDPAVPLLDRLKFLAITASNLDEFFMVRVGGLQQLRAAGKRKLDISGMTPRMQLEAIYSKTRAMIAQQYCSFTEEIEPALADQGILKLNIHDLNPAQEQTINRLIKDEIYPLLTPAAIHDNQPVPIFKNRTLYLLVRLAPETQSSNDRFATIPLDKPLQRIIQLPSDSGFNFTLLEEVVKRSIRRWFAGSNVLETAVFRLTRNADIAVQEDEAGDLLTDMTSILQERRHSDVVRLEIEASTSKFMHDYLKQLLGMENDCIFPCNGPLALQDFMPLSQLDEFSHLRQEDWQPQAPVTVDPALPIFEQVQENDILLYHPYERFDPVVRLIQEAARDPNVLAIKQVLYRTSPKSSIITALTEAAETGKAVTVLIELKARFDEERNIGWAQHLEQAGVQVIYGVQGLKTHAKVCLVIRREPQGIVRYAHFGTGNYNENTAKLYADVSFMTCNDDLTADASVFFNAVCGWSQPIGFKRAHIAPLDIREHLTELINAEISRARQCQKAAITLKMNSLVDDSLINKLYEASQAGVNIRLNIRGICCLKPGIAGLSENITVTSIIGHYLEHARIFLFHRGGETAVYITSADWMPRNLDRRVELMVPVESPHCRQRLIDILDLHCADTAKSWTLLSDGKWIRTSALQGGKKNINSQKILQTQACEKLREANRIRRTTLRPHQSKDK